MNAMNLRAVGTLAAVAVSVALSSCAAQMQQIAADDAARRAQIESTRPTCEGEKDCGAKWEAAQLWVVKHADMKLQTTTSVLIETYNSTGGLAMSVTKEPQGSGKYRIVAHATCQTVFVCSTQPIDAVLAFNRYVAEATP